MSGRVRHNGQKPNTITSHPNQGPTRLGTGPNLSSRLRLSRLTPSDNDQSKSQMSRANASSTVARPKEYPGHPRRPPPNGRNSKSWLPLKSVPADTFPGRPRKIVGGLPVHDMFVAGTDTTSATLVWTMTELIRHHEVMRRTQDEIRSAVRKGGTITESDLADHRLDGLRNVRVDTVHRLMLEDTDAIFIVVHALGDPLNVESYIREGTREDGVLLLLLSREKKEHHS
ncbi:Costunolide synthase [Nymphaea thermarum]|nr:Costunolide synthase [Nymphaea thermarum]